MHTMSRLGALTHNILDIEVRGLCGLMVVAVVP